MNEKITIYKIEISKVRFMRHILAFEYSKRDGGTLLFLVILRFIHFS